MEPNKPLENYAAKDYKAKDSTKKNRSPRKQAKQSKSLAGLPEKHEKILTVHRTKTTNVCDRRAHKKKQKK